MAMSLRTEEFYEFGPFRLDAVERRLLRDGETVAVTAKAVDVLLALVENCGRTVTKEELLSIVWAESFVEEANLTVNISALRRALGEGPGEHR
jgi:DNA-binding winged helix-turn-helix (wHTH) protein